MQMRSKCDFCKKWQNMFFLFIEAKHNKILSTYLSKAIFCKNRTLTSFAYCGFAFFAYHGSRRPGTNSGSKKIVKTTDLVECHFQCICNIFSAKTKKSAWKNSVYCVKLTIFLHPISPLWPQTVLRALTGAGSAIIA